jgi:2-desacetyl-2-hydroxyethyl bacteriochlorophyllide A dehydrogenase
VKALVLRGPRDIRLEERPAPRLGAPDDVLVRPLLTGICGTDLAIYLGEYPLRPDVVLGHEAIAQVVEAGPAVDTVVPGDRVLVNPTLCCGRCHRCLRGQIKFCVRRSEIAIGIGRDGNFAELTLVPARALLQLPADMPDERAVQLEPLACVLSGVELARIGFDDQVIVLGGGPVGLLWAMVAQRCAASVTVVEPDPYRGRLAASLAFTVPPDELDGERQASVVVDTTGAQLDRALELVEDGGRVVLFGLRSSVRTTLRPFTLTERSISLLGTVDYDASRLPRVIELARGLPCEALVTHRFSLEEHRQAFAHLAAEPGAGYQAMKVTITPNSKRPL